MSESLWTPATMYSAKSGLATQIQTAHPGSDPNRCASRGTAHRHRAIPATAIARNRITAGSGLPAVTNQTNWAIIRNSGP